ncbi:GRAM domain-containing 1B-like protein [Labeo rohita]|uniref:GRAM domain-containing 1B-like protein n=1 Tax=Labeo rohita TaxID=84645 RepID=A0A498NX24_LABRO|nr:GRAM domain-containing 1B-like protein [Labeo rohita]
MQFGYIFITASNSNRSSPACSPVLRKRCRSPILQNVETDTMVEKGSEQSDTSKSPSTPEQLVTRTFSGQSTRSGGKNSKKSQSWYNIITFKMISVFVLMCVICEH